MYSQLSSSQQQVLDSGTCPHCHKTGTVEERQTRNGPTVLCVECGKKVYRPRGRAVSKLDGLVAGSASNVASSSADNVHTNAQQTAPAPRANDSLNGPLAQSAAQGSQDFQQQNTPTCPKCGANMVLRTGKYGQFFGCVRYPKCDGTAKAQQQTTGTQQQQVAQAASNAMGKPLSSAAQDALNKMQAAVESTMTAQLQQQLQQLQKEKDEMQQQLQQALKDAVESLRPKQLEVTVNDASTKQTQVNVVQNAHPLLDEIIFRYNKCGIRNFLLFGPSGSCKSTIAKQLAQALGRKYTMTPWSGGTTEGAILGRQTPDGQYLPSAFVQSFETNDVHNWDELDRADPNVPLCANSAIENGDIFLPARTHNQHALRHPDFILIATANCLDGANMMYVGSNQADAALKSRFSGGLFYVGYDRKLEESLVPEDALRIPFWAIRDAAEQHKLRRIWGTRELLRGRQLLLGGKTVRQVLEALTVAWTPDELSKVGL